MLHHFTNRCDLGYGSMVLKGLYGKQSCSLWGFFSRCEGLGNWNELRKGMNGAWYGGDANAATWEVENCRVQWVQGAALMWFTNSNFFTSWKANNIMDVDFQVPRWCLQSAKKTAQGFKNVLRPCAGAARSRSQKQRGTVVWMCFYSMVNFGVATNMPLLGSKEISPLEGWVEALDEHHPN